MSVSVPGVGVADVLDRPLAELDPEVAAAIANELVELRSRVETLARAFPLYPDLAVAGRPVTAAP